MGRRKGARSSSKSKNRWGSIIPNNAEKWTQSEANEINSLIQSGAISLFYDGPVQSELNKSSRHINLRFHALRKEADFFTKQLPTPLYEQARRDFDANESYSNLSEY